MPHSATMLNEIVTHRASTLPKPKPSPMVEPSFFREFKENSSRYQLEDKQDSDEQSSDGEFKQADHMATFKDDDPNVFKIEVAKKLW